MLRACLLGRYDISLDDRGVDIPSRPTQSLLAYLLLNPNKDLRREKLAGMFWPEANDSNARSNLRHALWRIRKSVNQPERHEYLQGDDLAVTFNPHPDDWLDVRIFEQPGYKDLNDLAQKTDLYQGELLPGFIDEWVILERGRLQTLYEQKMLRLLDELAAQGYWPEVCQQAELWISRSFTPEPAYRALMLAEAAQGNMSGAAAIYQRCRDALMHELGVDLSPVTKSVYQQLLDRKDPSEIYTALVKLPRITPYAFDQSHQPDPGEAPYKGLLHYTEADAPFFFGRDQVVRHLVCSLGEWPALAVVGASGSGKSSIIRAGLIPALRQAAPVPGGLSLPPGSAAWRVIVMTPGAFPLENLAGKILAAGQERMAVRALTAQMRKDPYGLLRHLAEPGGFSQEHTLLVVDQFEEVFSLCREEADRQAFIDNLLHACGLEEGSEPNRSALAHLVIGLRADFYGACGEYALLRSTLARYQEYIGAMTATELRQAIECPAEAGGWFFETGLVDLLLRDSVNAPGGLPLLSHALLETWLQRRGRTLTLAGYAASGGLHAALGRSAESLFQKFSPWQQAVARSIFLRLTELRSGGDEVADPGTRRRAARSELLSLAVSTPEQSEDVSFVLNTLIESRLVTADEHVVELAHEALIREWPTLRQWLLDDRAGLALHRHITEAALNWETSNRDPSELYRGTRLAQAREWAVAHPNELTILERDFLIASRELAEQEAREKEAQQQRELHLERRARRFLQFLAGVLLAAVLISGGLAIWASIQRHEALLQASVGLAAQALNELEGAMPERAVLLTLEALEHYPYTPQAESALAQAVEEVRAYTNLDIKSVMEKYPAASQAFSGCENVFWSEDGHIISCASTGLNFWNADSLQVINVFPDILNHPEAFPYQITTAAPAPDGNHWAIASNFTAPEAARLPPQVWDIEKKETVRISETITEAHSLDWSIDGSLLASAHQDGTIHIWDTGSLGQVASLEDHSGAVLQVDFSPDGRQLTSASEDGTARIWDTRKWGTVRILVHSSPVNQANWSPDGKAVATGCADGTGHIWDAGSGKHLVSLSGHTGAITYLAWSPDGQRLATGSQDGTVRIWDAANGVQEMLVRGTPGEINGLAWSPDSTKMIIPAGYKFDSIRIWDVSRKTLRLSGHTDWMGDTQWSPDGKYIATSSTNNGSGPMPDPGDAWVFDAATGEKLFPILSGWYMDWSPNSKFLISVTSKEAYIWDISTGKQVLTKKGYNAWSVSAGWSADGTRIALSSSPASGGEDYATIVFDADAGNTLTTIRSTCVHIKPTWYPLADDPIKVNWFVTGCAYSHTNEPGPAIVWDARSGEKVFELPEPEDETFRAAWSPDGKYIAATSGTGLVRIWDVKTRKIKQVYAGHPFTVWDVAWSPDGKRLISGDSSGTANIWIAETGETVMTIKVPGSIFSVNWRPDGQYVSVTGTYEPPVIRRAWASTQALVDYAKECCAWRELTAEERVQFGLPTR